MQQFLHVGCGPQNKTTLKGFNHSDWHEVRFDIDPQVTPDILGSLTDMGQVQSGSVNAVFSSHNLEHLYPHEVPVALGEFLRVLSDDGFVVLTCPDLQSVCQAIVNDQLLEPLYQSPAGPISPIDILYGHRGFIAQGNHFMAHKGGFTLKSLNQAFVQAGFAQVLSAKRADAFDLWVFASKTAIPDDVAKGIALQYFP
jgi:hypothetical protein